MIWEGEKSFFEERFFSPSPKTPAFVDSVYGSSCNETGLLHNVALLSAQFDYSCFHPEKTPPFNPARTSRFLIRSFCLTIFYPKHFRDIIERSFFSRNTFTGKPPSCPPSALRQKEGLFLHSLPKRRRQKLTRGTVRYARIRNILKEILPWDVPENGRRIRYGTQLAFSKMQVRPLPRAVPMLPSFQPAFQGNPAQPASSRCYCQTPFLTLLTQHMAA